MNINRMKIMAIILVVLVAMMATGCGQETSKEIVVAQQYGLAYAPIVIMREKGFLEQEAQGYEVRWEKLGNTAAIREAMLTDNLDIGFMGIPPFLIGVDQSMEWKIISGLCVSPLGLMTNDAEVKSLDQLVDAGKIALPQPGSIQHILLAMAAENSFGDAQYFDHQLISMKHPEGYQAMMTSSDIKAHFTSPPYLFQEEDSINMTRLLSGDEAFGGEFSFIVGVCRAGFKEDQVAYEAFEKALAQSIEFISDNKEESIELLADAYELPRSTLEDYIYHRDMIYTQEVLGLQRFADFMEKVNYIHDPLKEEALIW